MEHEVLSLSPAPVRVSLVGVFATEQYRRASGCRETDWEVMMALSPTFRINLSLDREWSQKRMMGGACCCCCVLLYCSKELPTPATSLGSPIFNIV